MGGEKFHPQVRVVFVVGSPPRGRGKVVEMWQSASDPGITPAWAGKRQPPVRHTICGWDHPRMGGEKFGHPKYTTDKGGSPPRGRGKDVLILDGAGVVGITPAWAGKSTPLSVTLYLVGDHPRMGGEKNNELLFREVIRGSPPRGRGKGFRWRICKSLRRITPA